MNRRPSRAATGGFGRQGWLYLAALTAVACGVVALVFALHSQQSAPQPSQSARGTISVRRDPDPRLCEHVPCRPAHVKVGARDRSTPKETSL